MKEFEFTLKFSLPNTITDTDDYIKFLEEEGCDDALIGLGKSERLALQFNREGDNALEVVVSAIKAVERAIPGVNLIEATPDLVGISDIANYLSFSRQYIRKLILENKTSFPVPIHEGKVSLWHLSHVLTWLKQENRYSMDAALIDIAQANMQLNFVKEASNINSTMQSKIFSVPWLTQSHISKWDFLAQYRHEEQTGTAL